jgi:dynein heavy chain
MRCFVGLLNAVASTQVGVVLGKEGNGKAQTCRELSRSCGRAHVIYSCSTDVSEASLTRLIIGTVATGNWLCLKNFSALSANSLCVMSQSIMKLQAMLRNQARSSDIIELDRRDVQYTAPCGIFFTSTHMAVSRGIAHLAHSRGPHTHLPDSLRQLCRPVALWHADVRSICEAMLFAKGFRAASALAVKLAALWNMFSELFWTEPHYLTRLPHLRSLLAHIGLLRLRKRHVPEEGIVAHAMVHWFVPKMLSRDIPVFNKILQDCFPGYEKWEFEVSPAFEEMLTQAIQAHNLSDLPKHRLKLAQLAQLVKSCHAVIVHGCSSAGKTTAIRAAAHAVDLLYRSEHKLMAGGENMSCDDFLSREDATGVQYQTVYPLALHGRLTTSYETASGEVKEGVLPAMIEHMVREEGAGIRNERWIVFDGQTTGQWTKYLSLVYGEEATLCSAELERVRLPLSARIKFIFESSSIAHLSPQLISRCGVLYFDEQSLNTSSVLAKWTADLQHRDEATALVVGKCLQPIVETCIMAFPYFEHLGSAPRHAPSPVLVLNSALGLLRALLATAQAHLLAATLRHGASVAGIGSAIAPASLRHTSSTTASNKRIESLVVFACSWGFGSVLSAKQKHAFSEALLKRLQELRLAPSLFAKLPLRASIFDLSLDIEAGEWAPWSDLFQRDDIGSSNVLGGYVPTLRTFPVERIISLAILAQTPVLLFGPTQSGKSAMLDRVYRAMDSTFEHLTYSLRGVSNPQRLQRILESRTVHHGRSGRGPPLGRHLMVVIEDLNVRAATPASHPSRCVAAPYRPPASVFAAPFTASAPLEQPMQCVSQGTCLTPRLCPCRSLQQALASTIPYAAQSSCCGSGLLRTAPSLRTLRSLLNGRIAASPLRWKCSARRRHMISCRTICSAPVLHPARRLHRGRARDDLQRVSQSSGRGQRQRHTQHQGALERCDCDCFCVAALCSRTASYTGSSRASVPTSERCPRAQLRCSLHSSLALFKRSCLLPEHLIGLDGSCLHPSTQLGS